MDAHFEETNGFIPYGIKYYRLFGLRMEAGIVYELLDYDEKLRANYNMCQTPLYSMKAEDYTGLEKAL